MELDKEELEATRNRKCEYCNEDFDGWYRPLDKNGHLCVFDKPHKKILRVDWYGHSMEIKIKYCPMCGRKLV